MTVPADYDRLSDIISTTTGSLIRVYDSTTLIHEWLTERVDHDITDDGLVRISGPDIQSMLGRVVIYNFDYPDQPTFDPDWNWGNDKNLLTNGSFEDGNNLVENEGFEDGTTSPWWAGAVDGVSATLAIDTGTVDTGTFSADCTVLLQEGGMSTLLRGMYPSQTYTVTARVNGVAGKTLQVGTTGPETMGLGTGDRLIEVSAAAHPFEVQKDATGTGAYQTITYSFSTANNQTSSQLSIRDATVTPGDFFADVMTVTGYGVGMAPWEPSRVADVTTFEASTDVTADDGTFTGKITAADGHGMNQIISNVIEQATYTATIRIRNTSGSALWGLELQDNLGTRIDQDTVVTTTSFQTLTVTGEVPANGRGLEIQLINFSGGTATIYADTSKLFRGLPAATVGGILTQLFDDATIDHSADPRGTILTWLDYTGFSASVDSGSTSWAASITFTAHRGDTYLNIMRKIRQLGFEWNITPKASPSAGDTHELNVYEPAGLGTDHSSAATPSILFGQGTTTTSVIQRIPNYTAVLAEGDDGAWDEDVDATAVTNFGRWEAYRQNIQTTSIVELASFNSELLDFESENRLAAQIKLVASDDFPRPLVDYLVGDTVNWQIPTLLTKEARVVQRVAYRNTEPATYDVTGSQVFDRTTAAWEGVRRLLTDYTPLKIPIRPRNEERESGAGGGTPTLVVAASDALESTKARADYVCTGADDELEVQAAIDLIETSGVATGRVLLSEGTFTMSANPDLTISTGLTLQGMGIDQTTLDITGSSGFVGITGASGCQLKDFTVNVTGGQGVSLGAGVGTGMEGVSVNAPEDCIRVSGNRAFVRSCVTQGAGDGIVVVTGNNVLIEGNHLLNTGSGITVEGSATNTVVSGNLIDVAEHGVTLNVCSDVLVADNIIHEPGDGTDNTFDGILLSGDTDRNYITGNKIIPKTAANQPRYGINISVSTCDNTRIGDNDFGILADYGTFPLNDAGTNTEYPTARTADMSQGGTLSIGAGVARYPIAEDSIILDAHATVGTAPSGGPVTLDINKNGTTMYATATNPSIAVGTNVGSKAPADQTSFVANDYITLDFDAVNSAADLTCVVRFLVI